MPYMDNSRDSTDVWEGGEGVYDRVSKRLLEQKVGEIFDLTKMGILFHSAKRKGKTVLLNHLRLVVEVSLY